MKKQRSNSLYWNWPQPERDSRQTPFSRQLQPCNDGKVTSMGNPIYSSTGGSDAKAAKWRHKLGYLKEMIWGVDLVMVAIASGITTFWVNQVQNEWITSFLSGSKPAVTTLGAFYSFALVFRTNICYSRW